MKKVLTWRTTSAAGISGSPALHMIWASTDVPGSVWTGSDTQSGSSHSLETTPANDDDITQETSLRHGNEEDAFGDSD